MVKIKVEIRKAEYAIFEQIAHKLGLSVQALVQQEIDQAITSASTWLQRT